jgi:hypothetical protein
MIEPQDHAAVTALHTLPRVTRLAATHEDSIRVFSEATRVPVPAPVLIETIEPLGARAQGIVSRTEADQDPQYLARLNDVLLTGHRDLFTLDGLYLTDLAAPAGLHSRPPEVVQNAKGDLIRPLGALSPELVDETAGLLSFDSASSDDPAAWLLQTLPQLRLFERAGIRPDRLIVQPNLRPSQRETLRLLGWKDREILVRAPDRPIIFRELYVGYVDAGLVTDTTVYDQLREACPRRVGGPERLYVARDESRSLGRFLNEDRLIERVRALGFTVVTPGSLNLAEEIGLLQGARVVAGPLGGGLANALFADPGATIVALSESGHAASWVAQIAAARGHQHAAVFGLAFDSIDGLCNNWICDIEKVTRVLQKF